MKIDIDDLNNFEFRTQVAGHFWSGVNKSIEAVSRINHGQISSEFVVKNKGEVVEISSKLLTAVKAFNQL